MSQIIDMLPGSGRISGVSASGQAQSGTDRSAQGMAGNGLPDGQVQTGKNSSIDLQKAVVDFNKYFHAQHRSLEFSVNKASGKTVIKVIDRETGKVIRQIPPKYMLSLAQTLQETQALSSTGLKIKG